MVAKILVTTHVRRIRDPALLIPALVNREVLVGIPQNRNSRSDPTDPNNAMLLYIHEFGSPARNIPARPSLIPGVRAILPDARRRLKIALVQQINGDAKAVENALTAIGLLAVSSVKTIIRNKIPPPITDATKRWRLMKRNAYKNASPARQATMMAQWMGGDFTPLIDTGRMIGAITFVVRRR